MAAPDDKEVLTAMLGEKDEEKKIAAVKSIMVSSGAKKNTEEKIEALYREALKNLDEISVPEEQKRPLRELAERINNRDY